MKEFQEHNVLVKFSVVFPAGYYPEKAEFAISSAINEKITGALCDLFRERRGTFSHPRTSIVKEVQ